MTRSLREEAFPPPPLGEGARFYRIPGAPSKNVGQESIELAGSRRGRRAPLFDVRWGGPADSSTSTAKLRRVKAKLLCGLSPGRTAFTSSLWRLCVPREVLVELRMKRPGQSFIHVLMRLSHTLQVLPCSPETPPVPCHKQEKPSRPGDAAPPSSCRTSKGPLVLGV